ncbi:hypothetical protein LLEC1_04185 [Akanthomyces lecanii]|uniref:Uncharacterized protein n=1 Tax=Cordyceps confragosa TaxID=2714763 RepID=A0A179IML3_CORDF|nr:hypothetical protein LLEC1_04185 [Akanthomyces lecanii]
MNWSNGQLARHSRRSYNNDATKQKQYFAQAKRQKVTESRKRKYNAEDFVPSYLKDVPEKSDGPVQESARHRGSRRKTLTPQSAPEPVLQVAGSSEDSKRLEMETIQHNFSDQANTSIDAMRRKLLRQSDWSGVELQKPVIIRYPEATRSATKIQRRMPHDQLNLPRARTSSYHIPTDAVIKIASQEYRWSPGNNSIRTWRSKGNDAMPETPVVNRGSIYDISSSASRSFSSFVPDSPCVERALQIGRAKTGQEGQLQSVSHTSPSIFDEPPAKALPAAHYFHPQPVRRMPQSIYVRLADSAKHGDASFKVRQSSPPGLQSDAPSFVAGTESKSGQSVVPETIEEDSSSKVSDSARERTQPRAPNRQSLFERNLVLPPCRQSPRKLTEAAYHAEPPQRSDSLASSITTPDLYRIAEAGHTGNRLSALPYKCPKPTPARLGEEDENIMWKRFVLGPGHPVLGESVVDGSLDTLDGEESDNRSKLRVKTSALEAPTRMASRLEDASPALDTRQGQDPTPAPGGPTPPLAVSAEDPPASSMSLSNNPRANSKNGGPIDFREQLDALGEVGAIPTEVTDVSHSAALEVQHMTLKPESTSFHPPSLFVGRLAASGVASAAVAMPNTNEQEKSDLIPAPKAPSARVMSRRRRNKRREAGRPNIRALPNIQGDPIEYTP